MAAPKAVYEAISDQKFAQTVNPTSIVGHAQLLNEAREGPEPIPKLGLDETEGW